MSAVNDSIVREYFEMLGYLVGQPRKYSVPGRQKIAAEEIDLVIHHPLVKEHKAPDSIVWTTQDLKSVAWAIVAVRGWHTERFYVSTFDQTPDILRFVEPDAVKFAKKILGCDSMAKILCLPRLPATGDLKQKTIQILRSKGVDGIISFETILAELVDRVDTNKNYDKSDLLQMIRLLKNYDLIKERQLDLFVRRRRKAGTGGRKLARRRADADEVGTGSIAQDDQKAAAKDITAKGASDKHESERAL